MEITAHKTHVITMTQLKDVPTGLVTSIMQVKTYTVPMDFVLAICAIMTTQFQVAITSSHLVKCILLDMTKWVNSVLNITAWTLPLVLLIQNVMTTSKVRALFIIF